MSLEAVRVKEEVEWEGASEEWRVKEESAGLYAGHEVKRELVLGPERLQPQDVAFTLRAAREYRGPLTCGLHTEERKPSSNTESAKVSSSETRLEADSSIRSPLYAIDPAVKCTLRPCVVRLERVSEPRAGRTSQETKHQSRLPSRHKHERLTQTADTARDRTTGSDSVAKEFICDTCGRRFKHKKTLISHVQIHTSEKPMAGRKPLADYNILNMHGISDSHAKLHTNKICGKHLSTVASVDIHKHIHTASNTEAAKVSSNETAVEADSNKIPPLYSIKPEKHTLKPYVVRLERVSEPRAARTNRETKQQLSLLSRHKHDTARNKTPGSESVGKEFICDTCGRRFIYKNTLISHVQIHTSEKPSAEREPFANGDILNTQRITHSGAKAHCCKICGKQFTTLFNLQRHKRIHTGEKRYACDICKKRFSDSSDLTKHKRIHTGEKPYACDICTKQFVDSFGLTVHKRTHTGEKPYACDICKKNFSVSSSLRCHERVHTGERRHTCNICTKQFTTSSHLIQHKRIHTGEKRYTCDVCKKQFTELSTLKRHKRVHTGEKPYACNICTKKFTRSLSLKQHIKCIHTVEKPYACDYCEKQFSDLSNLKQHKCIHTVEKPYACDCCKKHFTGLYQLKRHKRVHTGEKPYACNTCTKKFSNSFSLKRHKQVHTGEKHYTCVICKEKFTDLLHLKRHTSIHII